MTNAARSLADREVGGGAGGAAENARKRGERVNYGKKKGENAKNPLFLRCARGENTC